MNSCTCVRFELLGACLAIPMAVLGLLAQRHGWPAQMLAATAGAVDIAAARDAARCDAARRGCAAWW